MPRTAAATAFFVDARTTWSQGDKVMIKRERRSDHRGKHTLGMDEEKYDYADAVLMVVENGAILQLGLYIGSRRVLRVSPDDVAVPQIDVQVGTKIS